jgi:uncharacterized membrane protein
MAGAARLLFSLDAVYLATAFVLGSFATLTFADRSHPRRWGTGTFWLLLGVVFGFGGVLPHWATGVLVIVMVLLDGAGQVRHRAIRDRSDERARHAARLGHRIFLPVVAIPAVTFGFAVVWRALGLDANRGALVGLGYGSLAAMLLAVRLTRSTARDLMAEGRRLNELMGSVNILPQLLASLGVIFTAAGIGGYIAAGIVSLVPAGHLFLFVLADCLSMAVLTMVLGNSFAAFPVIASGVLVPVVIQPFGADPAAVAVLTLTAGASGTLMTPMAANFNLVPVALLGMKSDYAVIRAQVPVALGLWAIHVVLMWMVVRLGT